MYAEATVVQFSCAPIARWRVCCKKCAGQSIQCAMRHEVHAGNRVVVTVEDDDHLGVFLRSPCGGTSCVWISIAPK